MYHELISYFTALRERIVIENITFVAFFKLFGPQSYNSCFQCKVTGNYTLWGFFWF